MLLTEFAEKEVVRPLFLTCGKENGTDKIEETDAKSDSQQQSAEHPENER